MEARQQACIDRAPQIGRDRHAGIGAERQAGLDLADMGGDIGLDEPTSALDDASARAIEGLVLDIVREWRMTWVIVTHNMAQARRIAVLWPRWLDNQPADRWLRDMVGAAAKALVPNRKS